MVSFHTKELLNITAVIKKKEKVIKKKSQFALHVLTHNYHWKKKKKIGKIGGVLGEDISRSS